MPPKHESDASADDASKKRKTIMFYMHRKLETAAALKRTVEALMERGAVVRNLENLGERALPYRISKHNDVHTRGGYFLVDFNSPPTIVSAMMDHLGRDIDVVRSTIVKHRVVKTEECMGIIPINYADELTKKKK